MNIDAMLAAMSPEIYLKIRQAVETGKWLDGNPLTEEQHASCMQAVMLYQAKIEKSDEHMTVGANGEIVHKSKAQFKQAFGEQNSIARFGQDEF